MPFWRATAWRSPICQSSWVRRIEARSLAAAFMDHDTTGEIALRSVGLCRGRSDVDAARGWIVDLAAGAERLGIGIARAGFAVIVQGVP